MEKFVCSYLDGCSFSTTINNKELVDLTDDEINTILKPILCFLVEKSDNEEKRRDNYATLVVDKINSLDLNDYEYNSMFVFVYNEENFIDKLKDKINNETDLSVLQMLYEELLSELGKYEDLGFCEQCCSHSVEYTYTVEL